MSTFGFIFHTVDKVVNFDIQVLRNSCCKVTETLARPTLLEEFRWLGHDVQCVTHELLDPLIGGCLIVVMRVE